MKIFDIFLSISHQIIKGVENINNIISSAYIANRYYAYSFKSPLSSNKN